VANFLLVSYAGYPYSPSSLCPDNGLAILAAVLQEAGHSVRILDFGTVDTMARLYPSEIAAQATPLFAELGAGGEPSESLVQELARVDQLLEQHQADELRAIAEDVASHVRQVDPAFVGFKLWNGDGYVGSVAIAETLKQRFPELPLVAGGPHATWLAPEIMRRTQVFEAVVRGEGEDKILAIAQSAVNGEPVSGGPGIMVDAENETVPTSFVRLDDMPRAVYDDDVYPAMVGDNKLKMIIIDESRGCPNHCYFCMHSYESGRRLRTRSATAVVDDMEAFMKAYGVRAFRFAGSSTPGSLMAEIAQEILDRGLQVRYSSFAHFRSSISDHFEMMQQSGLYSMFFGLESGSDDLLKRAAGKPHKLEDVRDTVAAAKAAGIKVVCSMIVPLPFETQETLAQSVALIQDMQPDSVPVQFPGLLPGSQWFATPERFGFEVDKRAYLEQNLDYKFKLMFPPKFWKALPYKLGGMQFHEFTQITADFVAQLEGLGTLTGVTDEYMLMAHLAGLEPRQLRDQGRMWFSLGDSDAVQSFVTAYNRGAQTLPEPIAETAQ